MSDKELFKEKLHNLHPTQMAVGLKEVHEKMEMLQGFSAAELDAYLREHPVPVVSGPGGQLYALDRHHLGSAMGLLAIEHAYCFHAGQVKGHDVHGFWEEMMSRKWAYPFDEHGERRSFSAIPTSFSAMKDDPFRSLAGYVRNAGGYHKDHTPFAEFLWADYFRRAVARDLVENDFETAIQVGIAVAGQPSAAGLPGFKGNA
jgi:hypothetical protein